MYFYESGLVSAAHVNTGKIGGWVRNLNNFHSATDRSNYYHYNYGVFKQVQQTVQVRGKGQRRKRPRPLRIPGQRRKNASVQL